MSPSELSNRKIWANDLFVCMLIFFISITDIDSFLSVSITDYIIKPCLLKLVTFLLKRFELKSYTIISFKCFRDHNVGKAEYLSMQVYAGTHFHPYDSIRNRICMQIK